MEVAVLGSPSLIVLMVSVDLKQTLNSEHSLPVRYKPHEKRQGICS